MSLSPATAATGSPKVRPAGVFSGTLRMPSSVDGNSGTSFTSRTVTVTRSSPVLPPSSRARTVTSYVLSGRASKSGLLTKLRAPLSNAKWRASAPVSVVQVTSSPSGSVAV